MGDRLSDINSSMKTFSQFLGEKWFATYEGHGYQGVTEVWINPTSTDIIEAARKRQIQVSSAFTRTTIDAAPARTAYYCRGWIANKHLFVWSADSDDHMNVENAVTKSAREQKLTVDFSNALAVELYYFPAHDTLGVHMAQWSNPHHLTDSQAVEKAKNHPAIKKLIGRAGKLIPVV